MFYIIINHCKATSHIFPKVKNLMLSQSRFCSVVMFSTCRGLTKKCFPVIHQTGWSEGLFLHSYNLALKKYLKTCSIKDGEKDTNDSPNEVEPVNYKLTLSEVSQPKKNVLKPPDDFEDVNFFAPPLKPTFNLAGYADKSYTLKQFIHLGVEIAKWEKHQSICFDILQMDFENYIKPYIFFLHGLGIPAESLGRWLTVNPFLFGQSLENLQVRINYLESKGFEHSDIKRIVEAAPLWLNHSVVSIDRELGVFQQKFSLSNRDVRELAVRDPKVILFSISRKLFLERNYVAISDQMGFSHKEQKELLLSYPRIYRTDAAVLFERFNIIHNEMKLSHKMIVKFPRVFGCRPNKLSERHKFLKFLGKAQYDPQKPNYVSPYKFISGTDAEFCVDVAFSSNAVFNDFLKTL